jgi:NADP-dependent 3-hydroxy acid dehydrogenase YdfG
MPQILGRVAKTLSKTTVVLNIGANDGVTEGTVFLIYEEGEEIVDPETKESLGRLEIPKGNVTAVNVQERMCVAEAAKRVVQKTRRIDPFVSIAGIASSMFAAREYVEDIEIPEKIRIDVTDDTYTKRLTVRVGDRARSV